MPEWGTDSDSTRRVKSELGLQFAPEPINKPIFLDGACLRRRKRLRFFDASIQTVEVEEQEEVIDI